jgi:two-component system, chemotaxis family, CheB/CheR fusion protein
LAPHAIHSDDVTINDISEAVTPNWSTAEITGILDTIDVPIVVIGRDCTVVRFNRAATETLGLTAADIGQFPRNIRVLKDVKDFEKVCARVIEDGVQCQRDIRNGNKWFLLRIAPYTGSDSHTGCAVLTFTNVTALRASIAQAVYEREFTKAILNTVIEPLVVLDAHLRVQTGNRAFYSIFGVSRDTQGVPLYDLGDNDWKTSGLWESLKALLSDNTDFQAIEIERDFASMGRRTVLVEAHRLSREWDPLILVVLRDITEGKQAEAQLTELMNREREARAAAEVSNRVKDEFLALVSHELRTPLSAIVGWTQLLKSGKLDQQQSDRAIQTIDRNAKAQATIINELLDMSRIISGKLKLDRQPIDLAGVINAAIDVVRPAADAKGIEIVSVEEPEAGLVLGDSVRLQQVAWNLLSNAINFTPKRGRVEVELKRTGTDVVIVVRDTGTGIRPDFLPYIFERFQQADTSEKRTHGGLGLGLSIVRNLVQMHGGSVRAESDGEGRGTTFIVTLPIIAVSGVPNYRPDFESRPSDIRQRHDDHAAGQQPAFDLKSDILSGLRVLAVDDQPDTRDLIVLALTRYGAEVKACMSATEALRTIQEWKPEVIVSDIGMPDGDGYDLMRKIRALDADGAAPIPAVALTGYAGAEDESKARNAGYQVHIAKPVEILELVATIAKLSHRE